MATWHSSLLPPVHDGVVSGCHIPNCIDYTTAFPKRDAVSDDNVESYQLPSHQLELPVVLAQDSIASIESVDLEPIPESVV